MKKINFVAIFMTCVLLISCGGLNNLGNGQTGSLSLELSDSAIEKVAKTVSDISGQSDVSFVRTNLGREAEEPEDPEEPKITIDSDLLKIGYTFTITDNTGKVYNEAVWFTEEELAYFDALYISKKEMDEAFWEEHPEYVQFKNKKYYVVFDELLAIRTYSVNAALQIGGTSYFYGTQKNVKIEPSDENSLTVQLSENNSYFSPIATLSGEYGDATRAGNYFTLALDYKFNEPLTPVDYSEDEEGSAAEVERLAQYSKASFQYAGLTSYPATISLKADSPSVKAEVFTIKDNIATKVDCSVNDGIASFKITKDDVLLEVLFTSADPDTGAYATTVITVSNFVGKQMSGYIMYKGGESDSGLWLESEIPEGALSCSDPEYMKDSACFRHYTIDYSNNLWYITNDCSIYCNGNDANWEGTEMDCTPLKLTYDEAKDSIVILAKENQSYCYVYCSLVKGDNGFVLQKDKCTKTTLQGLTSFPQVFAANDGHIYLAAEDEYLYHFYEGEFKKKIQNVIYYYSGTKTKALYTEVTDMGFKSGNLYTLNRYNGIKDDEKLSRGAIIMWDLKKNEFAGKYTSYGITNGTLTPRKVGNYSFYSPKLGSTKEVFGPGYFISNRPGCLVFADDGYYLDYDKAAKTYKVTNVNRIITFDVETKKFTMKDVEFPFMSEFSGEEFD